MASHSYLSTHHGLLAGFSPLANSRSAVADAAAAAVRVSVSSPPPSFAYDAYHRDSTTGPSSRSRSGSSPAGSTSMRDMPRFGRSPSSPGSSSLGMAGYPSVQEFPYGLSGVQMPTYNFGSELYNYVSNGFPRKSRMCSYCNKVFTRSTTRRYHEKRCPLLRASNSLAKNEENNSSISTSSSLVAAAMKEQQSKHNHQQQHHSQHQKDPSMVGGMPKNPSPLMPRTLSSKITNTTSAQVGAIPPHTSPPLPSLHPAYPTSFPVSTALASNPSRVAASLYSGYPHSYRSHFYNSISAAALASLDQKSNKHQESDNQSWSSSSPPIGSKGREELDHDRERNNRVRHSSNDGSAGGINAQGSSILGMGVPPLSKAYTSESAVDLTARYCADFSIRTRPPVFPTTSLRGHPPSPLSPDAGNDRTATRSGDAPDRSSCESPDVVLVGEDRQPQWPTQNLEKVSHYNRSPTSEIRHRSTSPPSTTVWDSKSEVDSVRGPYMQVAPLDEDDEDDLDDEEDEEEVEEDEEQFKLNSPLDIEANTSSLRHKSSVYNPLMCHYCKKIFADIVTRKAHEALHTQKKSFVCSLCIHSFHCAYSLRIHTLRHHKYPPYKCKYCLNSCDSPSSLKSHLLEQHSLPQTEQQSLKYFSLLTGSTSPPLDSIFKNAMSDGESDNYTASAMRPFQHRRSADNLPQSLTSINDDISTGKTTWKSTDSDFHDESLTLNGNKSKDDISSNVTGEVMETCKICNKAFPKSFIRFHERAHTDQKPYECPICNKRFGYKNNMKSHMKLHQGLKPYQCQICGARFTRGSTLRRHGRRHNISRNSMLDFVLYDHSAGPSRAMGVNAPKLNMPVTGPLPTSPTKASVQDSNGTQPYTRGPLNTVGNFDSHSDNSSVGMGNTGNTLTHPLNVATNGFSDSSQYNTTAANISNKMRSPTQISPSQHGTSPRGPSTGTVQNTLSGQPMTNPIVGGLAAVAAANLFAYPGAATAPQLYQFYSSTNPALMGYPPFPPTGSAVNSVNATQVTPIVQSDALNLSLGKRKSPFDEDAENNKRKRSTDDISSGKQESLIASENHNKNDVSRNHRLSIGQPSHPSPTKIKVETEEGEEVAIKREMKSLFTPYKNEQEEVSRTNTLPPPKTDCKEQLKISTEDFGAQVNICCPSPQVQSTTCSVQARASPSGMSQTSSSPVDSSPSPTNIKESQIQSLLLSLITSGNLFRCSYCEIYFSEYAMFRLHQKYHQCEIGRPFMCAVCGEDCKDKTYFTVHLSEHLGLGPKVGLAN